MTNKPIPPILSKLARNAGGTIDYVSPPLPDGSGFATMSMPLPKGHWLMEPGFNKPPMPFRLGTEEGAASIIGTRLELADRIREAARYAIRASTTNGEVIDFDPDAMVQNMIVGMLGYWTPNALSSLDGHDETPRNFIYQPERTQMYPGQMTGTGAAQTEAKRVPQISGELDSLKRAIDELHGVIENLEQRLAPVLMSVPPIGGPLKGSEINKPEARVGMALMVCEQRESVVAAIQRIQSLFHRCEV